MPVRKVLQTIWVFPSFPPQLVKFCPHFVPFEPSYVYGAGPFATACHWRMLAIVSSIMEEARMNAATMEQATL
jgi:hypothetical protein